VAKDVQARTSALRTALAKRLGKQRFELWFGTEDSLQVAEGIVYVRLPNLLFQRWVANQFREDILVASEQVLGSRPRIEFLLASGEEAVLGANGQENGESDSGATASESSRESPATKANGCFPETSCRELTASKVGSAHNLSSGNSFQAPEATAGKQSNPVCPIAREAIPSWPASGSSICNHAHFTDRSRSAGSETVQTEHTASKFPLSEQRYTLEPNSREASTAPLTEPSTLFPDLSLSQTDRSRRKTARGFSAGHPPQTSRSMMAEGAERFRAGRRLLRFSELVVGPCNQLAFAAAQEVARHPGKISPLFLFGPTSVGKTHLLQAICAELREQYPSKIALYLNAEDFTTGFVEALRSGGLPSFRQKYRQVDLLAIDDVQFFLGKRCTQRELLYTIDTLLADGKQMVLASDRPPEAFRECGAEFVARLQSGMVCSVDPPDEAVRLGIVAQLCRRLNLELPREVCAWLAAQIPGHARELLGALRRLQAAVACGIERISVRAAEEILADLVRARCRPVRLVDIRQAVCTAFGIEPEDLSGRSRSQRLTQPRILAMWLARKHTQAGLMEISRFFGRRSHSVVLSAQQTVERWLTEGKTLQVGSAVVEVSEIVRQLQGRLQAG
jgi:chromosomal replication initiator protein